jgi:ribosomal protein S18 acetylase RimI-like enzyme
MRPYVELVWGWDEKTQQRLFLESYEADRVQVITSNGLEIGFLKIEERPGALSLELIEILPEYQGRGIGRALIREVIARGVPVELRVLKVNPRARALYERLGFQVTGASSTHFYMRIEPGG